MAVATAVSHVAVVCVSFEPRGRNETPSANALAHLLVLETLVLNEKDRTTTQAITIDKFPDTVPLTRWAQRTLLGWKQWLKRCISHDTHRVWS